MVELLDVKPVTTSKSMLALPSLPDWRSRFAVPSENIIILGRYLAEQLSAQLEDHEDGGHA